MMADDRYVVRIDRDRDGITDETIDPEMPTGGSTEQPPHIDLPPRPNRLAPVGGWDGGLPGAPSRGHASSTGAWSTASRPSGTPRFIAATLAVVLVALFVSIFASRLVERANVSDGAATLIGLVVGVICAIGAFLAVARMTSMLGLTARSPVVDDWGVEPSECVLASAILNQSFRSELGDLLGADSDSSTAPVTLDIVEVTGQPGVLLRVLDDDDVVLSEQPFPDAEAAQKHARVAYGAQPDVWEVFVHPVSDGID